jgi:hypothetical protein
VRDAPVARVPLSAISIQNYWTKHSNNIPFWASVAPPLAAPQHAARSTSDEKVEYEEKAPATRLWQARQGAQIAAAKCKEAHFADG